MKFSVAAIIFSGNRYMFQKRDNKEGIFYPGFCGLFGGENLKNEKPLNCIKRELSEEINLNFKSINYFMTIDLKSKFFKKNSSILKDTFLFVNYQKIIKLK